MDDFDDIGERSEAAADRTAAAFEVAAERIGAALEGAARSGELSFERMAESILQSLARTAITDLIVNPLTEAIGELASGNSGGNVNVTMNVAPGADAAGFQRSSTQIAAGVARAVRQGQSSL